MGFLSWQCNYLTTSTTPNGVYRWNVIDRFNLSRLTKIYLLLMTPPTTTISFYLHRYYLEPASPLKSITNTAQLAPSQKQQLNSATILTNGTGIKTIEENAHSNLWASSSASNPITNGNGNANTNGTSHKTNDLTNGRWKLDLLSSDDNNTSLFTNHISVAKTNGNGQPINGFATMNGGSKAKDSNNNGSSSSSISRPVKNGFHLPPPGSKIQQNGHHNTNNNNLFTPDSDFVADFGSANIFDALNQKPSINNTNHNINNNNNNTTSANKSIQLNGVKHSNGIEMSNGNGNHQMNGNGHGNNHFTDVNKNVDENFADFEHNTIYNAAGEFHWLRLLFSNS